MRDRMKKERKKRDRKRERNKNREIKRERQRERYKKAKMWASISHPCLITLSLCSSPLFLQLSIAIGLFLSFKILWPWASTILIIFLKEADNIYLFISSVGLIWIICYYYLIAIVPHYPTQIHCPQEKSFGCPWLFISLGLKNNGH